MKEKEEERGAGEKEKRIMKTRKNDKRKKNRNKKNKNKENKKKHMEKKIQLALRYLTWRQSLPKTRREAGGIVLVVCIWLPQETDHVAKMFLD